MHLWRELAGYAMRLAGGSRGVGFYQMRSGGYTLRVLETDVPSTMARVQSIDTTRTMITRGTDEGFRDGQGRPRW